MRWDENTDVHIRRHNEHRDERNTDILQHEQTMKIKCEAPEIPFHMETFTIHSMHAEWWGRLHNLPSTKIT